MKDIWIEEVEIINFQSHRRNTLKFIKGTNALIGSSNSGKTAAIRAIRWCLLNIPNGTDFISVGEDEAVVTTKLSNGKKIERRRNRKSVNLYRLYEGEELIEEYTGFGSSVPPEIVEAHGITPIAKDTYFQFAHQLEAPFMLSLKPKQRADVLGNLEELARIDKGLSETNDDIRLKGKQKKELEKEEKQLLLEFEKLKLEAERLSGKIDTLKTLKQGIETKMGLRLFIEKQLIRLKEIQELTLSIQTELDRAARITQSWPEDLEERISLCKNLGVQIERLKSIKEELESIHFMKADKLKQLEEMKVSVEDQVQKFQLLSRNVQSLKANLNAQEAAKKGYSDRIANLNFSKLDVEVDKYKVLYKHLERLRNIDASIKETDVLVKEAAGRIDGLMDEFVNALREVELCPTCGQGTHEVCTKNLETVIN